MVNSDDMARLTVEVAQVMRKYGVDCRHNESLNFLQGLLAEEYIDGWAGKEAETKFGSFEYWEGYHKELNIKR